MIPVFYAMQAEDALRWLDAVRHRPSDPGIRVLDLGCGHGVFGASTSPGAVRTVTFADASNQLMPEHRQSRGSWQVDLDRDTDMIDRLGRGQYDLVMLLQRAGTPRPSGGRGWPERA
jgi:2-polyprenyl-3-methyl-5-hydroxy-6-metoxy-1,4-benzoquinol methylase